MKPHLKPSPFLLLPLLCMSLSMQIQAAPNAADNLSVRDAYVRAAFPGQPTSAAFMKLRNESADPHAIVDAESPVAKVAELHTNIKEGNMMKMRPVKRIDLKPHGKTVLQPGGLHVMLMGLKTGLNPGDSVPITLILDDGSKKEIQAPVRKMKMRMDMPMKGHKKSH